MVVTNECTKIDPKDSKMLEITTSLSKLDRTKTYILVTLYQ